MKKILIAIVAIIALCSINVSGQNITKNYHNEPMPNVLRDIDIKFCQKTIIKSSLSYFG